MLIKQNFELRGSEPPSRMCTPITGYFHDQTIISKEIIRVSSVAKRRREWGGCSPPVWLEKYKK